MRSAPNSLVAPRKLKAASSLPGITSGSIPSICLTPSINSARLDASRVALVAQKRIFSTPLLAMIRAKSCVAARVRVIASGSNALFLSTPAPSLTICISLWTSRNPFSWISATSKRMEFVPQSIAATRMGLLTTSHQVRQGLHHRVDSRQLQRRENGQQENVSTSHDLAFPQRLPLQVQEHPCQVLL